MLCARPEAVVLLGALLTASLDPAGEYPVPLASGCHSIPPEGGGRNRCRQATGSVTTQRRSVSGRSLGGGRRVPERSQGG